MPDLGQSFSPATAQADQASPNLRRRKTPVQQALQTLNLQLPAYTGSNAVSSDLLSGRTGGVVRQSAGVPRTQALLNAMMSGQSTSEGTGQGRARRFGGGFGGGGFISDSGGAAPGASLPGGGGGRPTILPKIPNLPGGGGMQGLLPGGKPPKQPSAIPGIPKLPPSLAAPPINPNLVGGGLVDRTVSAPPVNFNRGSNDVRFTTPIGQAPGTPQAPPPPPQMFTPAPTPPPQAPPSFALPGGGVDQQAQTNWYATHAGQAAPGGGTYNNSAPVASGGSYGPPSGYGRPY